jgi:hypothetical protein
VASQESDRDKYVDDEVSDGEERTPAKRARSEPSPTTPPTQLRPTRALPTPGASPASSVHLSATPPTPVVPGQSTPETPAVSEQAHQTLDGVFVAHTARLSFSPLTSSAADDDRPSPPQFQNTQDFDSTDGVFDWDNGAEVPFAEAASPAANPAAAACAATHVRRCKSCES